MTTTKIGETYLKSRHQYLSALLIFTILLGSCTSAPPLDASQSEPIVEDNSQITEVDDNRVQIVTGPIATVDIDLPDLGKADFATDPSLTVTADYPANGLEVVLTLIDNAGLTWQLTIPGNALDQPQTIRMTALSGVTNNKIPGLLTGGVLFEPDELQFFQPAILVVSGENLSSQPFLLTGEQDGTNLALALAVEQQVTSAYLYHFSTVFAGGTDEETVARQWVDNLNEVEKAVIAEARSLLRDKEIRVPEPPSVPIECTDEKQEKEDAQNLENFFKAVRRPEADLIQRLLSIKRNKALLGENYDELFSLELRLLYRLEKKANLLIKTYFGKPDKLLAVSKVALSIAHDVQLLGGDKASQDTFLDAIGNWCDQSIDQLINEIIEKHDYKKADAVWKVAKWATVLGVKNKTVEQIHVKLKGALSFQLKNKLDMHYPEQDWLLESEFLMEYNEAMMDNNLWRGQGVGNYISYTGAKSVPMQASPFNVNVELKDFDICAGTAKIVLDRFYANVETYEYGDEEDDKIDLDLVKNGYFTLFSDYLSNGLYTFPVTVHNLDAKMIEETIEGNAPGSGGKVTGEFGITLTHTPKK